ncbi:Tetrahydrocannabinolic acid synthase-like [Quillaja saponaria]|uniref:Tetrahydrocannabinolic acid synthase-like n=1 Tax=Quillaja saponaria TaxID=32244 RepID=A0AAD7KWS8_QUISA|nr:Tetrahydrocannabinolic acid synthase-like [Quillaja saponaria]
MSWIQSVLYFAGYNINDPLEVLLDRNQTFKSFKAKSYYVEVPIPESGLDGLWKILLEEELYEYMEDYVSKSPRAAYLNYRDLDLGVNNDNSSFEQAKVYGLKYFKDNFRRLVQVKTTVDPGNFLRNEQSIPLLPSYRGKV